MICSLLDHFRRKPVDIRVHLRRASSLHDSDPPWWSPLLSRQQGNFQRVRKAVLRCSQGHMFALATHVIDDAGKVEPLVGCPDCDWHGRVQLDGWSE